MIVTISRKFGSGGREPGKRLSAVLEIPCYDKEIIQMIADKQGFDGGNNTAQRYPESFLIDCVVLYWDIILETKQKIQFILIKES